MSNGLVNLRKMKSSHILNKNSINMIEENMKISPSNIIKDELISMLDDVKSIRHIDSKKEDRISKISFYLGKIFDKQIDKIQRNYSSSRDRKKEYSSTHQHLSKDSRRILNNFENFNTCKNEEHNKNLKSYINLRRINENSENSNNPNNFLDCFNKCNYCNTENKLEGSNMKNIQLETDDQNSNPRKLIQHSGIGLPPKIKRPPNNKSINKNNLITKNNNFTIYNHNFSIVNDTLNFGIPYSFELVYNESTSPNKNTSNKNIQTNKLENPNKYKGNLAICSKQESLSITRVKYKETHEISFDIKPVTTNTQSITDNVNKIQENQNSKETNQPAYKKPKIGSSSYRSNKENINMISNNQIDNTMDNKLENKNNPKSYSEKETSINNNNLENTKLYNKISSLNSTFLDYEVNNLNKIRIVSNKPSINMSHIENESIDETSIHKNSQFIDMNGVSYISEGIKGFFNNSTFEKSQIDDKNISFRPHRNNSSILNIQSPSHNHAFPGYLNQLRTENSSMSMNKETYLNKTTNNKNNRKVIDLQLKKEFESFKLKRIKNHTVDDDRYMLKNEESITNNYFTTQSNNDKTIEAIEINDFKDLPTPRLNNSNIFANKYSLCEQDTNIDIPGNKSNYQNDTREYDSKENKIQRLKSYKSIKLSNVDKILNQLPDKIDALVSPNLNFIRPDNNLIKNELRSTINEFHPLELENTMTSISITASQNLMKSILQPSSNIQIEKETYNNQIHTNNLPLPEKSKEMQAKYKISENINPIAKTIKKNISNKKSSNMVNLNFAKNSELLNDSLDSKNKNSSKKGSIIAKIKLNSTYSSNKENKEKSLDKSLNHKLLNHSVRDQKKEKQMNSCNSYKITI